MNPIRNLDIPVIANHLKSGVSSGSAALLSPQALEQAERIVREDIRARFDTVEIGGEKPSATALTFGRPLEELPAGYSFGREVKLTTCFTDETVSQTAQDLAGLMDENVDLESEIGFHMGPKQLAEHVGGIGKKIDEAYAAGQISQQELEDLNRGLEKYTESITGKAERRDALWTALREMNKTIRSMLRRGASDREIEAFAAKSRKGMQNQIDRLVAGLCRIDRGLLSSLIQRARGGEEPDANEPSQDASARENQSKA